MAGDWRSSTWGDEISLEYGKALPGHETADGRYRVFGSNGPIGWTSEPLAPGPGVILGRKGAYRGVRFSHDPFFVIDTAYYVVPKSELDMRWLYYAIKHYKLGEIDDGSPIPSTTRAAVYMLDLDVPPLAEQRAVAQVLGTLDDKIELNQRMHETLEAMARALFKSWFVDFDPVRAKASGRDPGVPRAIANSFPSWFQDSTFGEVPAGWRWSDLGDCADVLSGHTPPKDQPGFWGGETPWISPKSMTFIHADQPEAYVTDAALEAGSRVAPSLATLVMVRGMALHEKVRVSQAREPVAFNQDVKALVPRQMEPSLLFFAMLDAQPALLTRVESSGHGTGRLPTDRLRSYSIALPPLDTQRTLASSLDTINDRIAASRAQSRTLQQVREALMPELVSGQLRVRDAARFLEGMVA